MERCGRRIDCKSPRGHHGPCQEFRGGKLVFVDEDGNEVDVVMTVPPRGCKRAQQSATKATVENDDLFWGK